MKPRVILKTHSGVRRPGIFSVLVAKCTSATQAAHQEKVVKKLAAEFKDVPREYLKGASFGERGAAFHAVWMARPQQLGILTANLFWSSKGHALRVLTVCNENVDVRDCLDLSPAEQIIYLKYYLEGDGAILLGLARELVARGQLSDSDLIQTDLIERLLEAIWKEYLDLSTSVTERVQLRLKLERQSYPPSTRRHKIYPHLIPLEEFGLVERKVIENKDVFVPEIRQGQTPIQNLVERLGSVRELEKSIAEDSLRQIIAEIMFPGFRQFSKEGDAETVTKSTLDIYRRVRASGVPICPLDAITDASYALMLAQQNLLVTRQNLHELLVELESRHPQDVRFHVDRFGLPAYVVISDDLVDNTLKS